MKDRITFRRPAARRAGLAAAASTALLSALLVPPAAQAAPAPAPDPHGVPVQAGISSVRAEALGAELGPRRTAGTFYDRQTGRMVVTVTDAEAERAVIAAGGIAKRVKHSTEDLRSVRSALDTRIDTRGTTWGTDVDDNRINVTADSTVSDAEFAEMKATLEPFGDAATLTRVGGKLEPHGPVNGGKYIGSDHPSSCSAGFNVQKKSDNTQKYLLTAGHCTVKASGVARWYNGANDYFGTDAGGRYPGTDYGIIRHANPVISKPGNVYWHGSGQVTDITHSRDPGFGETVCMSAYRLGTYCDTVWELDVTAHYTDGDMYGLFRTGHCAQHGDSGGSIFHGNAALGIHSGGNNSGCIALHQRVNPALAWYGVEVY